MGKSKLSYAHPKIAEEKRVTEIKSLSYLERLERLMSIMEVSYMMSTATKIQDANGLKDTIDIEE